MPMGRVKPSLTLIIALLVSLASGLSFSKPLDQATVSHPGWSPLWRSDIVPEAARGQLPLASALEHDTHSNGKTGFTLQLEYFEVFGFPFYTTNIALGTPPQAFALLVDLEFGGVGVRSANCEDCGREIFAYNGSASSTSQDLHQRVSLPADAHNVQGALVRDNMHLMTETLPNASFGAIDTFRGENILLMILADVSDGILGLAPPNATSISYQGARLDGKKPRANFMYELISSGVLEHKTMAITLPRSRGSIGKLALGVAPPPVDHRIPFSKRPTPPLLEGTWVVDLDGITFDGTPYPFEVSLDLVASVTLSPDYVITLPHELAGAIYDYLGARVTEEMDGGVIDCALRPTLPDLTLVLGGRAITLGWRDYCTVWLYGGERVCVVAIERQTNDAQSAVLGLWLLQKFDLVFDMDRSEIGLIENN